MVATTIVDSKANSDASYDTDSSSDSSSDAKDAEMAAEASIEDALVEPAEVIDLRIQTFTFDQHRHGPRHHKPRLRSR